MSDIVLDPKEEPNRETRANFTYKHSALSEPKN